MASELLLLMLFLAPVKFRMNEKFNKKKYEGGTFKPLKVKEIKGLFFSKANKKSVISTGGRDVLSKFHFPQIAYCVIPKLSCSKDLHFSELVMTETFIEAGFDNVELLEQLYAQYQQDSSSVDSSWKQIFGSIDGTAPPAAPIPASGKPTAAQSTVRVYHLIQAYRTYGHTLARINPIDPSPREQVPELTLAALGFRESELSESFPTCGLLEQESAPLQEIIDRLKATYCGRIGVEYMGLQRPEMELWLQEKIEKTGFRPELSIDDKKLILKHLNRSELFEVFLHTKFTGQKRFSIEGGETLIPMLAAIIEKGADLGLHDFVIGMAHRGRLNVLLNILNKSHTDIFSEFEDAYIPDSFEGSGDVKYHKGFESIYTTSSGREVLVELPANPSHLESVNGVVEGIVRAKQVQWGDDVGMDRTLPILIHGDAAIAGQGIVYETMQLHALPGYATGGTIHVVTNNQIGFTTLPKDGRSTPYCTDIAKTFGAPVFHVNVEDPEGCVHATSLAVALRHRFQCDVIIDLNCYRKYGHNESDEPAYTQPLEYQLIRKRQPVREIYRDELVHQGVLEKEMAEKLEGEFRSSLQEALTGTLKDIESGERSAPTEATPITSEEVFFEPIKTQVTAKKLKEITERFCTVPEGFNIHRKLSKTLDARRQMVQQGKKERVIDWGMGEHLAFGSLLWEGRHVRLSGQDSRRGTFSHRQAMWVDQKNADKYFPLCRLKPDQGRFDVFNSPLSEYAVLGFEFGYSLAFPEALVLWEAQFGDFSNGAQIIIDQYIATAEQKWSKTSAVTLLLPHGYEGQGPEHSSARMERFLQLSGDANQQVVNPTTPAQLFHLLRAQVMRDVQKPLIVFTPKGLLRHPECVSSLSDFTDQPFQPLLDDPKPPKKCETLVLCNGRIYYDLNGERESRKAKGTAILRVEQLYPLDKKGIKELLKRYKGFKRLLWVQEEPSNMGAWDYIRPELLQLIGKGEKIEYVGRRRSASPAVGSLELHKKEHAGMMKKVFG